MLKCSFRRIWPLLRPVTVTEIVLSFGKNIEFQTYPVLSSCWMILIAHLYSQLQLIPSSHGCNCHIINGREFSHSQILTLLKPPTFDKIQTTVRSWINHCQEQLNVNPLVLALLICVILTDTESCVMCKTKKKKKVLFYWAEGNHYQGTHIHLPDKDQHWSTVTIFE